MSVSLSPSTMAASDAGTDLAFTKRDGASRRDTPEAIREAAGKFEALLIGQLLKAARQSANEGNGEDQTAASLLDMADEHLADLIASRGGLGLAAMVSQQLTPTSQALHPPARKSPRSA